VNTQLDAKGWFVQLLARLNYLRDFQFDAKKGIDEKTAFSHLPDDVKFNLPFCDLKELELAGQHLLSDQDKLDGYSAIPEIRVIQRKGIVSKADVASITTEVYHRDWYSRVESSSNMPHSETSRGRVGVSELDMSEYLQNLAFFDDTPDVLFNEKLKDLLLYSKAASKGGETYLAEKLTDINTMSIQVNLRVNLALQDSILISEFKLTLAEMRSKCKLNVIDSRYSVKFTNWIAARVLQYLDLQYWLKVNNRKLTPSEMADVLFADEKNGHASSHNIKNTTAKQAINFLSYENFFYLSSELSKLD
jgi:hypothetical protein